MISLTNQHDLFKLWVTLAVVGWLASAVALTQAARSAWRLRHDGAEGIVVRANLIRECLIIVKQSGWLWMAYEIVTNFSKVHLAIKPPAVAIAFTCFMFLAPGGLLFYSVHGMVTRVRLARALRREFAQRGVSS